MQGIYIPEPVMVEGRSAFGVLPGRICFRPTHKSGWTLGGTPIDPSIARIAGHSISLRSGLQAADIYEHIGVLRYFGYTCMDISTSAFGLTPFFGRGQEVLDQLKGYSAGPELPWYTVSEPITWAYDEFRGGYPARIEILPVETPMLTLEILCSYKELGQQSRIFEFPDTVLLRKVCSIHSQGLSSTLYGISRRAPRLLWPHHDKFVWAQDKDERTLERFLLHRAQDLLGGLSLLCQDGLFGAYVRSICSGHKGDLGAVKKAFPLLKRI